jgi:hypothetical protein
MDEGTNEKLRKLLLPGAASLLGAGAGLVLTRTNKLRDALPRLDGAGIGDLADDLRSKLGSVTGSSESGASGGSASRRTLDSDELEERLRRREQRRKQRAGR